MSGLIYFTLLRVASNSERDNGDIGTKLRMCVCMWVYAYVRFCPADTSMLHVPSLLCSVLLGDWYLKSVFPSVSCQLVSCWVCARDTPVRLVGRRMENWAIFPPVLASRAIFPCGCVYSIVLISSEQIQCISSFYPVISASGLW